MGHKAIQLKVPVFIFILLMIFLNPAVQGREKNPGIDKANSVEQRRILVSLQKEQAKLDAREKQLAMQDLELKSLGAEVDKKLNELARLRAKVQEMLKRINEEESKRVKKLSGMYEKMDPVKAAAVFASLDQDLAISILSGMKKKAAANLLDNLDPRTAAKLSTAFSTVGAD